MSEKDIETLRNRSSNSELMNMTTMERQEMDLKNLWNQTNGCGNFEGKDITEECESERGPAEDTNDDNKENEQELLHSESEHSSHEPILEIGGSNSTLGSNISENSSGSGRIAILTILVVFTLSISTLFFVYMNFPELDEEERAHVKFPTSIDDAKILGDILYRYKDKYFYEVLSGICVSYIFLQTFAIPGSIFLSIMSGFLFSFPVALLLICFCSATGASFCYLLSYLIGRRVVYRCFPERAHAWSQTVKKHKDNLLNYIIFLRITPLIPNWFINITAPVLDVPLLQFWFGTFIGVGPPSIVAIQAGTTLHELSSTNDAVSWTSLVILLLVGLLSLIPVILKDVLKSQFD